MRLLRNLALMACGLLTTAAGASDRDLRIPVTGGELAGTLVEPAAHKAAAVLLISGSGPTDRDGNSSVGGIRPATMKLIADGLAAQGIETLRYDKRGIAASAGQGFDESKVRFSTYVDDAIAAAKLLARQPGVGCVILAGHSEGALIALQAAHRLPVCGIISLSGSGRPLRDTLIDQLASLPEPLHAKVIAAVRDLAAGTAVDVPEVPALFRPSIQPYLMSQLAIDPAAEIASLKVPVMIVQGSTDLQVAAADAEVLRRARPDATMLLLDGTNHVLKPAPADRAGNLATYRDPALPLDPRLIPAMTRFVAAAKTP
jgi:uncharacterized protein